jgi:predicted nucleic acid-binding protein
LIYVDTSILLAQLLAEDHKPPASLWSEQLVSSRLAEYEVWNRIHARRLAGSHGEAASQLLAGLSILELSPLVLARALEPFPTAVRTLDAIHLASVEFLRSRRIEVKLATYDRKMSSAAARLKIPMWALS